MTQARRTRPRRVGLLAVAAAMVLGVLQLGPGSSPAAALQFCNTLPIIGTPGGGAELPPNPSVPYPSGITVSGLTGTVTDVNVTLLDLTTRPDDDGVHWPEDYDIMVEAPNDDTTMLMSDAGGDNGELATVSHPLNAVDVTLDDQAPNLLPPDSQITAGTYRPVDDDNDVGEEVPLDTFPGFAPPAPTTASLATFNGAAPNGVWNLWVVDDFTLSAMNLSGGWCVDILTSGTGGTTTTAPTTTTTQPTTTTSSTTTTVPPPTTTSSTTTSSTTTTLPPPTTTSSTTTTLPSGPICQGQAATIVGTSGNDRLIGTRVRDVIVGLAGDDSIYGLEGDDIVCGGDGNDVIDGGNDSDTLDGGAGRDRVIGSPGNDDLRGGQGADSLFGGYGNDVLNGGTEVDNCNGGTGTNSFSACEVFPAGMG